MKKWRLMFTNVQQNLPSPGAVPALQCTRSGVPEKMLKRLFDSTWGFCLWFILIMLMYGRYCTYTPMVRAAYTPQWGKSCTYINTPRCWSKLRIHPGVSSCTYTPSLQAVRIPREGSVKLYYLTQFIVDASKSVFLSFSVFRSLRTPLPLPFAFNNFSFFTSCTESSVIYKQLRLHLQM